MLDVCNKEDPLKGVPEPKVEGVGFSTNCRGNSSAGEKGADTRRPVELRQACPTGGPPLSVAVQLQL